MRATRFFFWTVILLFLFQNCGSLNEDSLAGNETVDIQAAALADVDLNRSVRFKVQDLQVDMTLANGEILASEAPQWEGTCLHQAKQDEIRQLLSEFGVCRTENTYPEDILCTMEYTFPYIEVFLGDDLERTKLGEATSGCPSESLHLCEDDVRLEELLRNLRFEDDFTDCNP